MVSRMSDTEKEEAIHIAKLNADVFKAARPDLGSCYLRLSYALEKDRLPTADVLRKVIDHLQNFARPDDEIGELGGGMMVKKQQEYSQKLLTFLVKALHRQHQLKMRRLQ